MRQMYGIQEEVRPPGCGPADCISDCKLLFGALVHRQVSKQPLIGQRSPTQQLLDIVTEPTMHRKLEVRSPASSCQQSQATGVWMHSDMQS